MSKNINKATTKKKIEASVPKAVDVVDGIPDRCKRIFTWKYVLIAVVFIAWVGFLIYCQIAGTPPSK